MSCRDLLEVADDLRSCMNDDERSLDEALEEIDRWSEQMVGELEGLAPDQVREYSERAQAELEKELGRPLKLSVRRAPAKDEASRG